MFFICTGTLVPSDRSLGSIRSMNISWRLVRMMVSKVSIWKEQLGQGNASGRWIKILCYTASSGQSLLCVMFCYLSRGFLTNLGAILAYAPSDGKVPVLTFESMSNSDVSLHICSKISAQTTVNGMLTLSLTLSRHSCIAGHQPSSHYSSTIVCTRSRAFTTECHQALRQRKLVEIWIQ